MRAFVMGLIASYGFREAGKSTGGQGDQAASQAASVNGMLSLSSDQRPRHDAAGGLSSSGDVASGSQRQAGPVEALRPFLLDHAERFWHELRCGCCVMFLLDQIRSL